MVALELGVHLRKNVSSLPSMETVGIQMAVPCCLWHQSGQVGSVSTGNVVLGPALGRVVGLVDQQVGEAHHSPLKVAVSLLGRSASLIVVCPSGFQPCLCCPWVPS